MKKKLLIILILLFQIIVVQAQNSPKPDKPIDGQVRKKKPSVSKISEYRPGTKSRPDVPFTNRLGAGGINVKGDITFIANNILNRNNGSGQEPIDSYNGNTSNGWLDMQYIDVDGNSDTSTFSSSSAMLNLPSCSRVVYAGLYWAAVYSYDNWTDKNPRDADFDHIKFKLPGDTNYRDITGQVIYAGGVTASRRPYVCYTDVTSIVQGIGPSANGNYFAANIKATLGQDTVSGLGGAAGWTMVVIYENDTMSSKNISIFDGCYYIDGGSATPINYSGFTTIPTGPVEGKVLLGALEGDRSIPGDSFQIQDTNGDYIDQFTPTVNPRQFDSWWWNGTAWEAIYDYDFFNGSISIEDQFLAGRNPASQNTLGFDVDLYEFDNDFNSLIANNQTSANLRFTTNGDVYWAFLNALAVEIVEPKVQMIKTVEDSAGVPVPDGTGIGFGEELFYSIKFRNTGTDDAENTVIVDQLPNNIDFLTADLTVPPGVTYVFTPGATPIDSGTLTFTIPDNMVQAGGAEYEIRFRVKVVADCSQLRNVCANVVMNQATASYTGKESGLVVVGDTSFSGIDACNLGTVGTSNFLIDIAGCPFVRDEILCGGSLDLVAGAGYDSYSWVNASNPSVVIGTNQTLTVTSPGTYVVSKTIPSNAPNGCVTKDETVNVIGFASVPNPFTGLVDQILDSCPSNTTPVAELYLCGNPRTINLPFSMPTATTVEWFKLDSCPSPVTDTRCANIDAACTWTAIGTNFNQTFADEGQYKVEIDYDGLCPQTFYLNVYSSSLNPVIDKEDLICGASADIVINGVPADYEYSLTGPGGFLAPFQPSNVFTVTLPGDYDLTIRRVVAGGTVGCTYTFPSINIQESNIQLDLIPTNMLCANGTAQIRAQVSNVPGDYTYTLTRGATQVGTRGPTASNDETFNVNDGGNYTVTVTTPNCTISRDVNINEPAELNLTAIARKDISCQGGSSDGIIVLNATGGTITGSGNYSFVVWSINGTPSYPNIGAIPITDFFTSTTYNVVNGQEGDYVFLVIDENNCTAFSTPVTINVEPELVFDHTANNISCNGQNDGSINVSVNGSDLGFSPIEYSINGPTGPWSTTGVFSGLSAGNYDIHIRASKTTYQCEYDITGITITEPPLLNPGSVTGTDLECNTTGGTTLGTLTFTPPTGGTAPYTFYYKLSTDTTFTAIVGNTVTNLPAGTYNTKVEDDKGCETNLADVTIEDIPVIPNIPHALYYDCAGLADITFSPPASPTLTYTYSLNGGTPQGSGSFYNVAPGTHTITVTAPRACPRDFVVDVLAGQQFGASITGTTPVSCNGAADGTITFEVTNFGGNYEYSLNGALFTLSTLATNTLTVGAGAHTIQVRPVMLLPGACTITLGPITLDDPTVVVANATISKEVTCGVPTGATIDVTASGGTLPYISYSIDGGATFQTSPSFPDQPAGTYNVVVKDDNGCDSAPFTLNVAPAGTVTFTATPTACYAGVGTGEIVVNASGGTGNYQFTLNSGVPVTPSPINATTHTFTGLSSGTYTIDVTDGGDCSATQQTVVIYDELTGSATVDKITCNDGSIVVNALGGDSTYEYAITPTGSPTAPVYGATNTFAISVVGDYDFFIRDGLGCVYSDTVTVDQIPNPSFTTAVDQPSCNGDTGSINITIADGVAPYTITVNGTATTGYTNTTTIAGVTQLYTSLLPDSYTIQVTDDNGCTQAAVTEVIDQLTTVASTASLTQDYTCTTSGEITFTAATGGTAPYTYGVNGTYSTNLVQGSLTDGTYVLTVKDDKGCEQPVGTITIDPLPVIPDFTDAITYNCDGSGNITITPPALPALTYMYSIDSGTPQASNVFANQSVGPHTITVTAPRACPRDFVVDVASGNTFLAKQTRSSNPSCNGGADGTITFQAINFSGSFEYRVNGSLPFITTTTSLNTIGSLSAGTYTIEVRPDASASPACTFILGPVTIGEPTVVVANATISKEVTCGAPTGATIDVTGSGGTPPYISYSIDGGATFQTSPSFPDQPAGTYNVVVKDDNGCDSAPFTLNVAPAGTVNFTATPTVCYSGVGTGEIVVNASGGTGNYQFTLNSGVPVTPSPINATTHTFTGLSSGTYTIDVTDGGDCSATQQTVIIYDELTGSATVEKLTCNDGSIVVNALGGNSTYEYAITPTGSPTPPVYGATNTFAISVVGNYDFFIRDGLGCVYSDTVTVDQIPNPSFTTAVDQPSCNGDTGSINITIADGVAPYTITVNGTATTGYTNTTTITGVTQLYTSLLPDSYTIQVTDDNGCTQAAVTEVIDQLTTVASTASLTQDYTCTTTGEITFTAATGGTAPYTYGVNGTYSTNLVQGSLTDGTYVLTVKDDKGCEQAVGTITIDPLPVIPDFTDAITYNCDGTGNITITPPALPALTYMYSIDSGTPQASNVFANQSVGPHTITVTAPRACPRDFVVDVLAGEEFTAVITGSTNVSCNGGTDGTITFEVTNFTGSYEYSVNGSLPFITTTTSLNTIGSLSAGTYTIEVRPDASASPACTFILGPVTIGEPTVVVANATITKDVTCSAPTGATIEVTGSGGTTPYISYSIDGGATFQTSPSFPDQPVGSYDVVVKDAKGCDSAPFTINVAPAGTVNFTATPTACYTGLGTGQIVVNASGGTGSYQFILNSGVPVIPSPINATTHTFNGLNSGTYTIDVIDGAGCIATQQTVVIYDELTGSATVDKITCNDGNIVVNALGGSLAYQYAITPTGSPTPPVFGATNTFPISVAGDYDFFIRDTSGCLYGETVTVDQIPNPSFTTAVDQPSCNGDTGSINITIADGVAPYTITVNGTATTGYTNTTIITGVTQLYTSLLPDSYTIQVTDDNGCTQAPIVEVINQLTTVASTASLTQDYTCTTTGEITFTAATGGTAPYTYGVNGTYSTNLVQGSLTDGTYVLTVKDDKGCEQPVGTITIDPLPVIPDFTDAITYNCDGTGNITITPPALPALTYMYSIDSGTPQASNVFANQSVGPHTITVTAPRACPRDFVVDVLAGEEFAAVITGSTNVSCNGGTDGTITFEVTNFTGSYEYSVNGGLLVTSSNATETVTGLDNIAYTIEVRPSAAALPACTVTLGPLTLTEPTIVVANATITKDVTCSAPTGATIEVTGSGGTTPYISYSIDGGATFQTNPSFPNQPVGSYDVVVKDAKGCDSAPFTINVAPATAVTFTAIPTQCYVGGPTAQIVVNASGGTGNYQFILNGSSPETPSPVNATTHTFSNLSNGTYTVDVIDGAGCLAGQQTVTVHPALSFRPSRVTNASCADGTIRVNPVGGDFNYVFSVVPAGDPVPADATFSNTNPISRPTGTYDVYIRDNNGAPGYCQIVETNVVVNFIVNVGITLTATQPICHGDTGSIEVAIANGQAPHNITVVGPTSSTTTNYLGSSITFSNLLVGTYDITITDILGCSDTQSVTLTDPVELITDLVTVLPPGCAIDPVATGFDFINVDPADYAPHTLQYSLDNGSTWTDVNTLADLQVRNLNSGDIVYPVLRVSDGTLGTGNTRCIDAYGMLEIPYNVSGIVISVTPSGNCANGYTVLVDASGGSGNYLFSLNDSSIGVGLPSNVVGNPNQYEWTGLIPGVTYDFFVRDTKGTADPLDDCIELNNSPVDTSFADVQLNGVVDNNQCSGAADGKITFTITTTSTILAGETISWELYDAITHTGLGITGSQTNTNPIEVNGLTSGDYYLVISIPAATPGLSTECSWGSPNVTVDEGTPIVGNLNLINNITCDVDGKVEIQVNGGFPNYTYTVNSYETGTPLNIVPHTLTGNIVTIDDATLGAVTSVDVEVLVTDTNGCTTNLGPTTLTLSTSPTIDLVTPSTCGIDKEITVTVSGGTAPYQYSSDGGTTYSPVTASTTYTFTPLSSGSYDIMVKDASGCTDTAPPVVLHPELNFALTTGTSLTCVPGNASINIALSSGAALGVAGNYTYTITAVAPPAVTPVTNTGVITGTNTSTTHDVTAEGEYSVVVTDVISGCSETRTLTVLPVIAPNFTGVATVDNICFGSSTGEIQLTEISNSINPLSYAIVPALGVFDPATLTYTGLPAGSYDITGTGTNGCTTMITVAVNENPDIVLGTSVTEFGCTTGNVTDNATVTVTAIGGSGTFVNYAFVYDGGTPVNPSDDEVQSGTSPSFVVTNELGGNVVITVTDDRGCTQVATETIAPFNGLSNANLTVTKAVDCNALPLGGADVSITFDSGISAITAEVVITGAVSGHTATQTGVSPVNFTGVPADTYTVTITNPITGCVLSTGSIVDDVPNYEVVINNIQNACYGSTGSVDLSFNPGTPYNDVYSYEIFNAIGITTGQTGTGVGNVTTTINTLTAGEYYIIVTMPNTPFCLITSANFTIAEPTADLTLSEDLTYLKCNPLDSGEVVLTANGGWGTYQYELVNTTTSVTIQSFDNNNVITGLVAGNYQATVRDANNCTEVINFHLDPATTITGAYTVTPNDCIGEFTASIEAISIGGGQLQDPNLEYIYALQYPDGTRTTTQTSPVFTNLPAGVGYSIIVFDGYSCNVSLGPIDIVDPTKTVASGNILEPITCNSTEATVEISGSGGTGPYQFSVDGINFFGPNAGPNYRVQVLAGEHQFFVRDTELCVSEPVIITVAEYIGLTATLDTSSAYITCNGDANAALSANAENGLGNYEYQLLDGSDTPIDGTWQTSNSFYNLNVGTYKIHVRSTKGIDVCSIITGAYTIDEPTPLVGNVAITQNVTCFGTSTGIITATATGGNGDYEYNIVSDPSTPEYPASKFITSGVFNNLAAGVYWVTVKDKVGCINDPVRVEIVEPDELQISLVNVTEQTCLNSPTPTITVDVLGGTAPYYISINGIELASPYGPGNITLGATEGIAANTVYSVSVRDSGGGCDSKAISSLITAEPVDLQLTVDYEYTCPTGNIIKAIVADKYKSNMTYSLYQAGTLITTNTTGEFIDVPAGNNYTVTATDTISSCSENSTSDPIDIDDVQALTMTIDDSQKNKLIANVNFGVPPYNFTVDGVDYGEENEFLILQTKEYTITVTDARGCEVTMVVNGVYITIKVLNLFTPDGDGINDYWYPLEVESYHDLEVIIFDRYAREITKFRGMQQGWDGNYDGKPLPAGDYWYTIYYNELSGEQKKLMGHFTLYR